MSTSPPSRALGFWQSTIGLKILMALSGAVYLGFLVVHMLGNLLVFAGRDALNAYSSMLKSNALVLWGVRGLLIAALVTHVAVGIKLTSLNQGARGVDYRKKKAVATSFAAQFMIGSGLTLLAFIVYHLLHLTLGVTNPAHFAGHDSLGRHDVYGMVIQGFRTPIIALAYLVAMACLWAHLRHAATSLFNTLGFSNAQHPWLPLFGPAFATVIVGGNVAIVLSVATGLIGGP